MGDAGYQESVLGGPAPVADALEPEVEEGQEESGVPSNLDFTNRGRSHQGSQTVEITDDLIEALERAVGADNLSSHMQDPPAEEAAAGTAEPQDGTDTLPSTYGANREDTGEEQTWHGYLEPYCDRLDQCQESSKQYRRILKAVLDTDSGTLTFELAYASDDEGITISLRFLRSCTIFSK